MEQLLLHQNSVNHDYQVSDYILSNYNYQAYSILLSFKNPSLDVLNNCLLLEGPKYSGKTHLAKVWQFQNKARLLSPKYDPTPLAVEERAILVEDIDLIKDELWLLYIINYTYQNGKILLMSCNSIVNMQFSLADLQSRINSCLTITLSYPDSNMMKIFAVKQFHDLNIKVSSKLINHLVHYCTKDIPKLKRLIYELNERSLKENKKISVSLIKNLL